MAKLKTLRLIAALSRSAERPQLPPSNGEVYDFVRSIVNSNRISTTPTKYTGNRISLIKCVAISCKLLFEELLSQSNFISLFPTLI